MSTWRINNLRNGLSLAALVALATAVSGCRSKLDVHSQAGAPMPKAPPTVTKVDPVQAPPVAPPPATPDVDKSKELELAGTKVFFQTRDAITIQFDRDVIDGADKYSVLNVTQSGDDDSKAVTLINEAVPKFGLTDEGFNLAEVVKDKDGKQQVQVTFYPGQDGWKGKFFYGKNKLKVIGNHDFAFVELTLHDFDVFDVAITSFSDNVQIEKGADYQFQGWVNVLSPPVVTVADAGGANPTTLTTGMFNMVNPQ